MIACLASSVFSSVGDHLPNWSCDPAEFGAEILDHFAGGARRFMAARDRIGDDRFVDIGQPELHADPLGVVERIYDFAGLDLTDDVRASMVQWSREHRAGSRGEHKYSAEEFGLTSAAIRHAFSEYLDRYGKYCALTD